MRYFNDVIHYRSVSRSSITRFVTRCMATTNKDSSPSHFSSSENPPIKRAPTQNPRRDGLGKPKGYSGLCTTYKPSQSAQSGLPNISKPFIVLGIESSCDDTGVAIVKSDGTILSNIVISQYAIHEKFGGIVPSLAMEAHKSNIQTALNEALKEANLSYQDIDAVAATRGPGLEICLRVGYNKGRDIAREFNKPFVAVHHLEAHCLMARLAGKVILPPTPSTSTSTPISTSPTPPHITYPFLALIASGGHTSILICHSLGSYSVLGGTLDDSLGEVFDKAARLLGLDCSGGSGGAAVERAAKRYSELHPVSQLITYREKRGANSTVSSAYFNMRVPMRAKMNCDLSYAGLKNSFRVAVQHAREKEMNSTSTPSTSTLHTGTATSTNAPSGNMEPTDPTEVITLSPTVSDELCYHFQDIAFTHLEDRLDRALDYCEGVYESTGIGGSVGDRVNITGLVVVGGVAANQELRRRLLALLQSRALGHPPAYNTLPLPPSPILPLIFPPPPLCTDNGVMSAWAGVERLLLGGSDLIDSMPSTGTSHTGDETATAIATATGNSSGGMGGMGGMVRGTKVRDMSIEVVPRWPLGEMKEGLVFKRQK